MTTAIFLLTLSFAYIVLGTCAQFVIAVFTSDSVLNLNRQHLPFIIIIEAIFICLFFMRYDLVFDNNFNSDELFIL